jgi:hypothetical protein
MYFISRIIKPAPKNLLTRHYLNDVPHDSFCRWCRHVKINNNQTIIIDSRMSILNLTTVNHLNLLIFIYFHTHFR